MMLASLLSTNLNSIYNILDFAAINAKIVYNETNGTKLSLRMFILLLIQELTNVNSTMDDGNDEEAAIEEVEFGEKEKLTKRKACQVRQCKNNKSNLMCYKCKVVKDYYSLMERKPHFSTQAQFFTTSLFVSLRMLHLH